MTTLTLRLDGREVVARVDVSGQVFIDEAPGGGAVVGFTLAPTAAQR